MARAARERRADRVLGRAGQPVGHRLLRLGEDADERARQLAVIVRRVVEEADGLAQVAAAPGAPDSVHVLVHRLRQVVVDDVVDLLDVEAARRDGRAHDYVGFAGFEGVEGGFALALEAVAVKCCGWIACFFEEKKEEFWVNLRATFICAQILSVENLSGGRHGRR